MKIVLDTNVLLSGMLNPSAPPGRIVDFLRTGVLQLVIDDRIIAEYTDVLRREYFLRYFEKSEREDVIEYLSKNSFYTTTSIVINNMPDKGDISFLEIALSENVPLVTGNLKHYPKRVRKGCIVLSPRQFMNEYFTNNE
ncbi:MAG: putative toxin-antitoxin system toxin component, PIN family [Thermodesulfobacteriota bacterium]|nr:putative toxin-antitoxin system toxin component, PIN family [Thermodesulfobacteriota bacterium]